MTNKILEEIKDTFDKANLTDEKFNVMLLFTGLSPSADEGELRRWALGRGMKAERFDLAHGHWRAEKQLGGYPKTVKEFVELYAA